MEQPVGSEILMTVPGASGGASVASGAAERMTGVAVATAAMARAEKAKKCIVVGARSGKLGLIVIVWFDEKLLGWMVREGEQIRGSIVASLYHFDVPIPRMTHYDLFLVWIPRINQLS